MANRSRFLTEGSAKKYFRKQSATGLDGPSGCPAGCHAERVGSGALST